MNKPEFLKGEAKSFENLKIDYDEKIEINFTPDKIPNASYALTELLKRLVEYNKIKTFLTQDFDQRRIPELFDNIKKVEDGKYAAINSSYDFYFNEKNDNKCTIMWTPLHSKNQLVYFLPAHKTLNDFIRDCERAGITLIWKSGDKK